MSFAMPPMPPMPPATAPPPKKRRAFDLTKLPPEMQMQLRRGQPVTFEDGSTVYPDGTAEGAGDSPDDYTMGPASPPPLPAPPRDLTGGPPPGGGPAQPFRVRDGGSDIPSMGEEEPLPAPDDPFAGRQFDRHFAVRDGAPDFFGTDEEDAGNPMMDTLAAPFETPAPAREVRSPSNANPLGAPDLIGMRKGSTPKGRRPAKTSRTIPGRMGKRPSALTGKGPATKPQPRYSR